MVRSYHGGVQARTADLVAGLLFGLEPGGTDLVEDGFSYAPGTLFELTLPTRPSLPRSRQALGSGPIHGGALRLQLVNCFFDPERGLADADRTRLATQIKQLNPAMRMG